jgi:predicted nuclease of predicted toxin-antitoxin system
VKILFDQGVPAPLRRTLTAHHVSTAHEQGWGKLKNGDLLRVAEARGFETISTTDQNLRYQQNLSARRMAIIVLMTTDWRVIRPHASSVADAVGSLEPNAYLEVDFPAQK